MSEKTISKLPQVVKVTVWSRYKKFLEKRFAECRKTYFKMCKRPLLNGLG